MNCHYYKFLLLLLCLSSSLSGQSQPDINGIETQIQKGNFTNASLLIDQMIAKNTLIETEKYNLLFRKEQLNRIRIDFPLTELQIKEKLRPYFPKLTDEQLRRWEKEQKLEMKIIDGKRRYFKVAVGNLFRLDSTANVMKIAKDGKPADALPGFLNSYLPVLLDSFRTEQLPIVDKRNIRLKYKVTLPADVIPAGETVRCWLPYPREDESRQSNIQLIKINVDQYIVSPTNSKQRSIYCEKVTRKGQPTVFEMEFSFDCRAEWVQLNNKQLKPYDINSDIYKTYTAERLPHIIFSDRIKNLTKQIVGNETDTYTKVQRIYRWIDKNITWCSALEYSTIDNIPEYVLTTLHDDCGMQTLLFMTITRYAGIPCKWQSGWMLHPVEVNLHDWCEVYYEGMGWIPLDQSFGEQKSTNPDIRSFYISGIDGYRLIVNDDFSQPLFPAKIYPRSETVDFQRGEMEWRGGNLYFDKWNYKMAVDYSR